LKIKEELKRNPPVKNEAHANLKELSQKMKFNDFQNREKLQSIWNNVRNNQEQRVKNQIEARDLEHELMDLRKMKGKLGKIHRYS